MGSSHGRDIKKSIAITHCNEYTVDGKELENIFDGFGIYMSDGMTRDNIYNITN